MKTFFFRFAVVAALVLGVNLAGAQNPTLNHISPTGPTLVPGSVINTLIDRANDGSFNEITAAATPFNITGKSPATATTAGGAIVVVGGVGGATSGAGGAVTLRGGAATAGNSAGGAANVTGGLGSGSAA